MQAFDSNSGSPLSSSGSDDNSVESSESSGEVLVNVIGDNGELLE